MNQLLFSRRGKGAEDCSGRSGTIRLIAAAVTTMI